MLRMTALREARNWSKSELSRQARMTPSDVGRIESGRTKPYLTQLWKLAAALGVDEDEAETLLDPVEVRTEIVKCCCPCHSKK